MSLSPQPPSRSSSLTEEAFAADSKKTRRRFAKWQTAALEKLYATRSHPSKEEREKLAELLESNLRAVTIWFQNKRQTDRRVGSARNRREPLLSSTSISTNTTQRPFLPFVPYSDTEPLSSASTNSKRSLTRTGSGFSLDRVASRSELMPRTPRKLSRHKSLVTPGTQTSASSATIWDSLPSSPFGEEDSPVKASAVASPSTRDLLEFASNRGKKGPVRGRRTLEWACAAARAAPGNDDTIDVDDVPMSAAVFARLPSITKLIQAERTEISISEDEDEFDVKTDILEYEEDAKTEIAETEVESVPESHEAITPQPSLTYISRVSSPLDTNPFDLTGTKACTQDSQESLIEVISKKPVSKDHDTMSAAWTLCGLKSFRN